MQTFGSLLLTLLAASSLVSAAPSPEPGNAASEGGTFRVPVVARATGTRLSVAEMHARVLRKYGRPIPPQTAKAVARAQEARAQAKKAKKRGGGLAGFLNRRLDGGIAQPLTGDVMYLTEVQIGTPPKLFHLDFDTGSDDAWVFGTDLPKTEMNGQQIYDPAQSSTSALLKGATWNITYGDHSSSSGIVYTDKMAVGDVVSEKQAVGVAQNLSKGFAKESTSDGLLGLAPKGNTIKPEAQPSFFQNVIPTLKAPLFTVNLNHKTNGSYIFGSIDKTAFTGPIYWTDSNNQSIYWPFLPTSYAIGDVTNVKAMPNKVIGIADTGTTLLLLPEKIVASYYAKVAGAAFSPESDGYIFPCTSKLPDFSFGVGQGMITIPGAYLAVEPSLDDSTCYGGIQRDTEIGFPIFGDMALKCAFVVFDYGNSRLGFAKKPLPPP